MTTTPSELQRLWEQIAVPPRGQLSGRRVSGSGGSTIWVALDHEGVWYLLVEVPAATAPLTERGTRGLRVELDEWVVEGRPAAKYIGLGCTDVGLRRTHACVAADIADSLSQHVGDVREAVSRALAKWRRFWSVPSAGLSAEAAAGLFGELWFMERWIGLPRGLECWTAPTARHDFQSPRASVEVKTTTVQWQGAATHRIGTLDQLAEPELGRLLLFSLQLASDDLSANTLPAMVERVRVAVQHDPVLSARLMDQLAEIGYSPADSERYVARWRIVAEGLYCIDGEFPRLTRASFPGGLPAGIDDVSYSLSLVGCRRWLAATRPEEDAVRELREEIA